MFIVVLLLLFLLGKEETVTVKSFNYKVIGALVLFFTRILAIFSLEELNSATGESHVYVNVVNINTYYKYILFLLLHTPIPKDVNKIVY